jgi:hypothetical protein
MVTRLLIVVIAAVAALPLWLNGAASASSCSASAAVDSGPNDFVVSAEVEGCDTSAPDTGDSPPSNDSVANQPVEVWVWRPICDRQTADIPAGQGLCNTTTTTCPEGQTMMRRWRIEPLPKISGAISCMPNDVADQPVITPELVLRAFRRIPLPEPETHVQPDDTTLVNLETIFYTDAAAFDRSITLLGQRVDLAIEPTSFRWVHGDGTTSTTQTAGAAYPSKDVVHRYQHAHTTVRPHVEVTWSASYRVGGGPAQTVPGTVTTVGPTTVLRVAEAVPALSGAGH